MDQIEGREQRRALDELIRIYDKDHRFTATDIRRIHQLWLGNVYEWAGEYRHVNVSKDGFMFAAAEDRMGPDSKIEIIALCMKLEYAANFKKSEKEVSSCLTGQEVRVSAPGRALC